MRMAWPAQALSPVASRPWASPLQRAVSHADRRQALALGQGLGVPTGAARRALVSPGEPQHWIVVCIERAAAEAVRRLHLQKAMAQARGAASRRQKRGQTTAAILKLRRCVPRIAWDATLPAGNWQGRRIKQRAEDVSGKCNGGRREKASRREQCRGSSCKALDMWITRRAMWAICKHVSGLVSGFRWPATAVEPPLPPPPPRASFRCKLYGAHVHCVCRAQSPGLGFSVPPSSIKIIWETQGEPRERQRVRHNRRANRSANTTRPDHPPVLPQTP